MDDSSAGKEQQEEVQEKESEADENNNSSLTLVQSVDSSPAGLEINPLYVRQMFKLVNFSSLYAFET